MADKNTGPDDALQGVVEGVKGKAKEAAGSLTGNREMQREGRAQQDKADARREAAGKEAAAERARLEAEEAELEQRSHQR